MKHIVLNILVFGFFVAGVSIKAQTLDEQLLRLQLDEVNGYVQPLVSAYASDLNSGWSHSAPSSTKFSFDFDAGIVVMGTIFQEEHKTFDRHGNLILNTSTVDELTKNVSTKDGLRDSLRKSLYGKNLGVRIFGPTIVGSTKDSVHLLTDELLAKFKYHGNDTTIDIQPYLATDPVTGLDIPSLILAAPQASIGTIFGTKVTVRYLPPIALDKEIGDLNYFGFGIQHNPFAWLPFIEPPLDVSVGFFTQSLTIGDKLKTTTTLYNAEASKRFGMGALNVTPFVGVSAETADMEINYVYKGPDSTTIPIHSTLHGENSVRFTVGTSVKVGLFKFTGEYNVAKFNSFALAFGIII